MREARGLLLIARTGDPAVQTLQRLAPRQLVHADVQGLSRPGWQYAVGRPQDATAQAQGQTWQAGRFAAVLCRVHQVHAADLPQLHVEDRAFAAIEMSAFLRAWLAQFPGLCCNPPSAQSLTGPAWHPVHARWLAAQCGVPVAAAPAECEGPRFSRLPSADVTVVGDRVLGARDPAMAAQALRLAAATACGLLELRFVHDAGWRLLWMQSCPPMDEPRAAALIEWTLGACRLAPTQSPGASAPAGAWA